MCDIRIIKFFMVGIFFDMDLWLPYLYVSYMFYFFSHLQAIAVVSCIRESWPVLVLVPSSLRLHWASVSHGNFCVLSGVFALHSLFLVLNADDSTVAEYSIIGNTCMVR